MVGVHRRQHNSPSMNGHLLSTNTHNTHMVPFFKAQHNAIYMNQNESIHEQCTYQCIVYTNIWECQGNIGNRTP